MASISDLNHSITRSLATENWYAALSLALTMPDLCSYAENGTKVNGKIYAAWFDKWIGHKYIRAGRKVVPDHIFLVGSDAYALRCAFLHQGQDDISAQSARQALNSFRFQAPSPGNYVHCNQVGDCLQLQVDIFCQDIVEGVQNWSAAHEHNCSVNQRANALLHIYPY